MQIGLFKGKAGAQHFFFSSLCIESWSNRHSEFSQVFSELFLFCSSLVSLMDTSLLMAQMVNNLAAVQETWIRSLGGENPLEKGTATHSRILAWIIPWTEEPGGLQSMGLQIVRHDWATNTGAWTGLKVVNEERVLRNLKAVELKAKGQNKKSSLKETSLQVLQGFPIP